MIVVKVGGSLYDHPRLGPGLRAFLGSLAPSPVLLVPGGGAFADAVRKLDAVHGLGEERSHWIALRAMSVAAEFLTRLLTNRGERPGLSRPSGGRSQDGRDKPGRSHGQVFDAFRFAAEDDTLPHSWAVTSDSIAARAAVVYRAERLILLKSVDIPPGTPWVEAAANGWVDPHFPKLAADAPFPIATINFRRQLDDSAPS